MSELFTIGQIADQLKAPPPQYRTGYHGYCSPLPAPDVLRQYNDIVPNGTHRVMAMIEKQWSHQRLQETTALKIELCDRLLRLVLAIVLAGCFIIGLIHATVNGITLFDGASPVSIISVLISLPGRHSRPKIYDSRKAGAL